jgi:hypothetical protein
MSSGSNAFYQSAKGNLAMRMNNAEQLAEAKAQEGIGLKQQQMAYDDEIEHAKANRDTAIFGLSLGGSGAYKIAYGAGRAVGKKFLMRGTARLQNAVNAFRKARGQPTDEDTPPPDPAEQPEIPAEPDVGRFQIQTPQVSVTEEGVGGTVKDANGEDFDPKTLDMSDPENPRPFPPDETPQEFPQTQEVARDGYGNRFDPSSVDTSDYANPQAVRGEDIMGAEGVEDQPITRPPPGAEAGARPAVAEGATEEIRPAGSFEVQTPAPARDPINDMANDIRNAPQRGAQELDEAQDARLTEIERSNPILTEDHIGTLKSLGADFGDMSPEEVDTAARYVLGDTAVEGLSSVLGAAGSAIGAAMPVLGLAGDIAGLYFAGKSLADSKEAVQQELNEKGQAAQALANLNIPLNVPKTQGAPVMDTSAMRQGGIQNF